MTNIYNVEDFGAVFGPTSAAQRSINTAAISLARDAAIANGGGEIGVGGNLHVDGILDFSNLGQCNISLVGHGGLNAGSRIALVHSIQPGPFDTLENTSFFTIRGITLDANFSKDFVLYCGRDVNTISAGKHLFDNVRVVNGNKASYLNKSSEDNTHIHCQFNRSPIGVIITGYPIAESVHLSGQVPVNFSAPWISSISHNFYDCTFGDPQYANRAGLMIIRSQCNLFGGVIFSKPVVSEAAIMIDGTQQMSTMQGILVDAGLSDISMLIGKYSPVDQDHCTRLNLSAHLTMSVTTGTLNLS